MADHDPDYDGNDLLGFKVATGLYDLDQEAKQEYWLKLRSVLRSVFGKRHPDPLIKDYRKRLRDAGPETEFLAYHVDPLQVAADLVGREILTLEQKVAYSKILEKFSDSHNDLPNENMLDYVSPEDAAFKPAGY